MLKHPHTIKTDEISAQLNTNLQNGLTGEEVQGRLAQYGENRLEEKTGISPWAILASQFSNIITVLLLGATAISLLLGDYVEAVAIMVVIVLNATFGFITEYRAEQAMEALKKMVTATAKVVRDSKLQEINAEHLVPGDVLVLEEGDQVTADARLVEAENLATVEASLTGESQPVDKKTAVLEKENLPVGDRVNMVYMGTMVVRGIGRAVVTATGKDTEIGHVSTLLEQTGAGQTPLEKRMADLGRTLAFLSLAIAALMAVVGIAMGRPVIEVLETAIALAIAAVPEGLPAVSTITLAIGMTRMARQNAIIRRLPAVETLGSTTVICTDKTGTLTENEMTLEHIWLGGRAIQVTGTGYKPEGDFLAGEQREQVQGDLELFLMAGALASNASVNKNDTGQWDVVGDPTEGALVVAAMKGGFNPENARRSGYKELKEIPFNSDEKRMAVYYQMPDGKTMVMSKGAPGVIMESCSAMLKDGIPVPLDQEIWRQVEEANDQLAHRGLRVLAVAYRHVQSVQEEPYRDLILIGLAGIMDPPREEAKQAIAEAARAGIRTIMITGDQPETASAIGSRLGLAQGNIVHGSSLHAMSKMELSDELAHASIFARVNPKDKLNIVDALQEQGAIVAMTGDGVNDAPALKEADIGIAMGQEGTVVAKEAADMVLQDDNFATIIKAVKEGRVIFDNITKFIHYLFSCNLSEILLIFVTLLMGVPLPLVALQILWLNLVTDVFPALSLGWEPAEKGIMDRPPRDPSRAILTNRFKLRLLIQGIVLALGTLASYLLTLNATGNLTEARTVAFATLAVVQLFHIFNVRHGGVIKLDRSLFSNPYMWGAIVLVLALQALAIYQPLLNRVLQTVPLNMSDIMIVLITTIASILIIQVMNRFKFLYDPA
ncbi:cation-translocating P-type ATPase [Desulfoscipio gibsoniae]|uniref:P-type Ca(2+) transporter n=1 Tax=Desulfoscipio gibsoniae DSM 7213 TaxID=767817 RepID=R4KHG4_9FIRM|nr:HAD-IC family P-type ATPase [Desulfoscipio gibsoniae]AGK99979.1 P-type ATPase, translocating [Desulfoscipio gibsoniae DSM 7213]